VYEHFFELLILASGLVSGLIGTYVGLQNRALLAEVRKEMAELENRFFLRINGTYVRASECKLKEDLVMERITTLAADVKAVEATE
jgi:hypothetical protein